MNFLETLKIKLVGGVISERDLDRRLKIEDLIKIFIVMNDPSLTWDIYNIGLGLNGDQYDRTTPRGIARHEASEVEKSVKRFPKKAGPNKIILFKNANLETLKKYLIIKLKEEIKKLASASSEENELGITDPERATYLKNIKEGINQLS